MTLLLTSGRMPASVNVDLPIVLVILIRLQNIE